MNNFVLMAEVVQPPQIRYTQDGQTAIAEVTVQFPGSREGEPANKLKVLGFGNMATIVQDQCLVGQQYVLTGQLRMNLVQHSAGFKEKVAEFYLSQIYPIGANFDRVTTTAPSTSAPVQASPTPPPQQQPFQPTPSHTPAVTLAPQPSMPEPDYDDIPF